MPTLPIFTFNDEDWSDVRVFVDVEGDGDIKEGDANADALSDQGGSAQKRRKCGNAGVSLDVVEEPRAYWLSKCKLAERSLFFRNMWAKVDGVATWRDGDETRIVLRSEDERVYFGDLLRHIYGASLGLRRQNALCVMLELADRFCVTGVVGIASGLVAEMARTGDVEASTLNDLFKLPAVMSTSESMWEIEMFRSICVTRRHDALNDAFVRASALLLDLEPFAVLLADGQVVVCSENVMWRLLCDWLATHPETSSEGRRRLFGLVRYTCLTEAYRQEVFAGITPDHVAHDVIMAIFADEHPKSSRFAGRAAVGVDVRVTIASLVIDGVVASSQEVAMDGRMWKVVLQVEAASGDLYARIVCDTESIEYDNAFATFKTAAGDRILPKWSGDDVPTHNFLVVRAVDLADPTCDWFNNGSLHMHITITSLV
jgi:hypothetical protein